MKVAVIEFNQFHDELLPSTVSVLNRLGIEPDVYMPSKQPRMDPFAVDTGLRYRRRRIGGRSRSRRALTRLRGTPSRFTRYDALMMNSIEPVELLAAVTRIDLPTIATLHNANLLRDDEAYRRFFAAPGRLPLFLGRHIAAASGVDDPDLWMTPYVLGGPGRAEPPDDDVTTLCVAGNVQFGRRDYAGLMTAVEELARERSDFVVRVVGRSDWRDGRELRKTVSDRGLGDRFTFTEGQVSHAEYQSLVASADFVLPLLDPTTPALALYYSVKMTSTMSMSIGLGVVPIAESRLATLYGVEDAAVTYLPGDLTGAIRAALSLTPADRAARRERLSRVRTDGLAASVRNLAGALQRLGLDVPAS